MQEHTGQIRANEKISSKAYFFSISRCRELFCIGIKVETNVHWEWIRKNGLL